MPLHELSPDIFGYALSEGYSHGRSRSFSGHRSYAGPTRYRLLDDFPVYIMKVSFDWTDAQYNAFQQFHTAINYGQEKFRVLVVLTLEPPFDEVVYDTVPAQMVGMFQADFIGANRWRVTMDLELPYGTNVTGTLCDVIFAGVPSLPSPDDIFAGTPDNPSIDIIAPCPFVDPQELAA